MPHEAPRTYPHAGLTQSILAGAICVQEALVPGLLNSETSRFEKPGTPPRRVWTRSEGPGRSARQESGRSWRNLRPGPSRPGAAGDPRFGRGSAGRPRTRSARAAGPRSGPGPGPVGRDPRLRGDDETIRAGLLSALCAALHAQRFQSFGQMHRDAGIHSGQNSRQWCAFFGSAVGFVELPQPQ